PFQRRRHWVDAPTAAVVGPEEVTETDESVSGQVDALWRELLGIEEINAADDLFVLGGDSLVAMRLIARADHTFGTDLPLDDFLDEPTPARMAELVRTALTEKDGVRT
ncbi:acyl carrier protein, partial [Kibdelosporangium lantanae]